MSEFGDTPNDAFDSWAPEGTGDDALPGSDDYDSVGDMLNSASVGDNHDIAEGIRDSVAQAVEDTFAAKEHLVGGIVFRGADMEHPAMRGFAELYRTDLLQKQSRTFVGESGPNNMERDALALAVRA